MVVAPTSSGKTLIGEVAALRSIVTDGKPAVWLLPARALAAEVAEIARRWNAHGIRTIELTGETARGPTKCADHLRPEYPPRTAGRAPRAS
ncbi:hypothetical protein GCM10009806_13350 [Microbacterium flavum]